MNDATLTQFFLRRLDPDLAAAMLVKFRAAERRLERSLPLAYADTMVRNYYADEQRRRLTAERRLAREVVAKAERIEAERRATVWVEAAEQYAAVVTPTYLDCLTEVQGRHLEAFRLVAFEGFSSDKVAELWGLSQACAHQYVCRGRKRLLEVATADGLAELAELLTARTALHGGLIGFND